MQTINPRGMTLERPHAGRKSDLYTKQTGRKLSDAKMGNEDIKDAVQKVKGLRSWEDHGF